jgi:hypothetical protein
MESLLTNDQIEQLDRARALVQQGREIVEKVLEENHAFFITRNGHTLDKSMRQTAHSLELLTLKDDPELV